MRFNISLLIEITLVIIIAAILAIRLLAASSISRVAWFVSPDLLVVVAALIPTTIIEDMIFPRYNAREITRIRIRISLQRYANT